MEGIIAKCKDSIYRPGKRTSDWLKIKARLQQEFVVGGDDDQQSGVTVSDSPPVFQIFLTASFPSMPEGERSCPSSANTCAPSIFLWLKQDYIPET